MKYSGFEGIARINDDSIIELVGFALEQTATALDASKMDGTCDRRVKNGQLSWSGTIDAFYDPDDIGLQHLVNGVLITVELYPEGINLISGSALIVGASIPIEKDGMITQSISIEGVGELITSGQTIAAWTWNDLTNIQWNDLTTVELN